MNKTYLTVGALAVVAFIGVSALQSHIASPDGSSVSATAVASQDVTASNAVLVTYTDTGFIPRVLKVPRGASIRFINTSGKALKLAPQIDAAYNVTTYQGFAASKSVKKGESFETSVTLPGVWGYKNANDPGLVGVVIVE